jgi:hypothetical protein
MEWNKGDPLLISGAFGQKRRKGLCTVGGVTCGHCNMLLRSMSKAKQRLGRFCAFPCHFGDKGKKWAILFRTALLF